MYRTVGGPFRVVPFLSFRKHHEEVAKCFKHVSTSSRSTQNTAGQVRSTRRGSRDNMRALLFRVTLFVSVFVICAGPIFIMSVINLVNGALHICDVFRLSVVFTILSCGCCIECEGRMIRLSVVFPMQRLLY